MKRNEQSDGRTAVRPSRFLRPVTEHPLLFLGAGVLSLLPDLLLLFRGLPEIHAVRNFFFCVLLAVFRSYLLTLPLLIPGGGFSWLRIGKRIYQTVVLSAIGLLAVAECFLLLRFDLRYTYYILLLLWETDLRESSEFLTAYAASPALLGPTAVAALAGIGLCALRRRLFARFEAGRKTRLLLTILLLAGAGCYAARGCRQYRMTLSDDYPSELFRSAATVSMFERLHTATFWFRQQFSAEQAERLLRTLETVEIQGCSFRSPCIVLIIGESFNKHHSELYGYPLPTNPRLRERMERGELHLFREAETSANITSEVLTRFFSVADDIDRWADAPLFPALFRKAGYAVCYLDNQSAGAHCDYYDVGLKPMFNSRSIPLLFTAANDRTFPYDGALVEEYDRIVPRNGTPELTIFHLMGQHMIYRARFPEEYALFETDDIPRTDLDRDRRQTIADYDNATRYNDAVVDALIDRFADRDAVVVYLSDHGEEIYDYRDFWGRSHGEITHEVFRHQYEIPMMIWTSASYRRNRPDLAERIARAADRPFRSDDLSHLLLDLAGIRCRWSAPARSALDDRYAPSAR